MSARPLNWWRGLIVIENSADSITEMHSLDIFKKQNQNCNRGYIMHIIKQGEKLCVELSVISAKIKKPNKF